MKRTKKKLQLETRTIAKLATDELARVRGGGGDSIVGSNDPQGCTSQQGSVRSVTCY